MKTLPCRLILRGDRIDGLVTQSDLLKLPVRIVVFGLLAHLEMVMADLVSTHWSGDEWMTALSPGRRAKLLEKETVLRQRGLNPPRIELTEFADKRDKGHGANRDGLCCGPPPSGQGLFRRP